MSTQELNNPQAMQPEKHPPGLSVLFFTEMWERFSYYGLRALLILYMTATKENGGLGLDVAMAAAIYGLFTAAVYLTALPGGWIADRLVGAQRALFIGAIIIVLGHISLALHFEWAFFLGLFLIAVGTGLLKPSASALVGQLYPVGGYRRDAGYTIFYVGINIGAFIGPLICAYLGEKLSWQWGFIPAAVGMVCGIIQYKLKSKCLGLAGLVPDGADPTQPFQLNRRLLRIVLFFVGIIGAIVIAMCAGIISINAITLAKYAAFGIATIAVTAVVAFLILGNFTSVERNRFFVIVILMVVSVLFWAGFEQAGSSLTIFANEHTDRKLSWINFEVPAGWFLSLNPLFIILLAPVFSRIWMRLGSVGRDPSLAMKFAIAMGLLSAGFFVMMIGSTVLISGESKVSPLWLFTTYMLFTFGEICLSPIGLSAVATLSPKRFSSQMLGLWFLATSLGNLVAGLMAGQFDPSKTEAMPDAFMHMAVIALVVTVILIVFAKPISRLVGKPDTTSES